MDPAELSGKGARVEEEELNPPQNSIERFKLVSRGDEEKRERDEREGSLRGSISSSNPRV